MHDQENNGKSDKEYRPSRQEGEGTVGDRSEREGKRDSLYKRLVSIQDTG